jgi:lysozyme
VATTDGPRGVDVSHHQASTPSLVGFDFLIARASIGTTTDRMYATHIKNARAKGLVVGAYHFNWSTLPVAAQVKTFLDKAGDVDLYFLDVEYAGNGVNAFSRAQATDFIQRVRATGRKCGLYMSESAFYANVPNDYRWVANWSQPPSMGWTFWQYQGSPLDKNRFNGSLEELRAFAGGSNDVAQRDITAVEDKLILIKDGQFIFDLDGTTKLAESAFERPNVLSPVERGTDSEGRKWREFYIDLDGAGPDPKRSALVRVRPENITDVPAPEPPAPAPAAYPVRVEVGGQLVTDTTVTLP